MTDPRTAALAEALRTWRHMYVDPHDPDRWYIDTAAAIRVELQAQGWDVQNDEEWNARAQNDAAVIDRLREALESHHRGAALPGGTCAICAALEEKP